MTNEICNKCGDQEGDLRTLFMACFYEMNELDIPFTGHLIGGDNKFYTLRVCKQCREDWMIAIKDWFEAPIEDNKCDSGIYIREFGKIMQVTKEEFEERSKRKD